MNILPTLNHQFLYRISQFSSTQTPFLVSMVAISLQRQTIQLKWSKIITKYHANIKKNTTWIKVKWQFLRILHTQYIWNRMNEWESRWLMCHLRSTDQYTLAQHSRLTSDCHVYSDGKFHLFIKMLFSKYFCFFVLFGECRFGVWFQIFILVH